MESTVGYTLPVEKLPEAFAYHRIVTDDDGEPVDYVFLDVNSAFEKMTGLEKDEVLGKRASNLLPTLPEDPFPWIDVYGNVALNGKSVRFERYSEPLDRWFDISAYSDSNGYFATIFTDITERVVARQTLKQQEEELAAIYENAPLIMLLVDEERRVRKINGYAEDFTGKSREEMVGLRGGEALACINALDDPKGCGFGPHCDACEVRRTVVNTFETEDDHYAVEVSVPVAAEDTSGEDNTKDVHFLLYTTKLNFRNEPLVLVTLQDITDRREAKDRLEYLSFHDALTGLYNRAYIQEQAVKYDIDQNLPASVIMGDIDGLKLVNDAYGHHVGDELLVQAAEILKASCRSYDAIARWGGDEFLIFLPRTTHEEAEQIIMRILSASTDTWNSEIPVSISLGCATKTNKEQDIEEVWQRAEDAMFKQKLASSRSVRNTVLRTLLRTLEEKSHETRAHVERMQKIARTLGQTIGLHPSELNRLDILISLHDIGKINVPQEILTKPGRLTEEEWATIKKHPIIGFRIASGTEEFSHVAKGILHHHEHWDGSGYPDQLKGEEIPILARITALADAYDAMTHDRPYRKAMSDEEAVEELKRCAGSQFDPMLVDKFVDLYERGVIDSQYYS